MSKSVKPIPMHKSCKFCGNEYPNTDQYFPTHYSNTRGKSYLKTWCRICDRSKRAEYRAKNPDMIKAQKKRSHERNREHNNRRAKNWRQNNLEHARAKSREGYRKNKPIWFARVNARYHSTRAKGLHTPAEIAALYEQQQGLCAYCKRDISKGYHKDHVIPVSRDGRNTIDNIALACARCNSQKHDKLLSEWTNRWYEVDRK